ncbi:hypothetical protein DS906_02400 [Ruegeria sp. A3M17]|nr:hypothetical protein DS906_02400 [Ruegeria sp. A3M17]
MMTEARTGDANQAVVDRVRADLKRYLSENTTFLSMSRDKQVEMYREMLSSGVALAQKKVKGQGGPARAFAAGDDLDPTGIRDVPGLAAEFMGEIDFVGFVSDLITGTYDSIVDSTIKQSQSMVDMFKQLSKPLGAIARDDISSLDAQAEMATSDPLRFTMGPEGDLTDSNSGMAVDTSNDEIQKLMFEARLKLAKERRLQLREVMLQINNRLVVTEGVIRAGLVFNVRSTEVGQAKEKSTDIQQKGGQGGGSFFGLFGGGGSKKSTKITVSSRELVTNTELNAQITGFVEVKFKSDYFKLDNFADLFGDESTKALIAEKQGAQQDAAGQPA